MFDIGFWELALIGLLALVILGPERLPEVARTAGIWFGRARRFVSSVKQDLEHELNSEELAEFKKLKQELDQTRQILQQSTDKMVQEFNKDAASIMDGPGAGPDNADATLFKDEQRAVTGAAAKIAAGDKPAGAKKPARKRPKRIKKAEMSTREEQVDKTATS